MSTRPVEAMETRESEDTDNIETDGGAIPEKLKKIAKEKRKAKVSKEAGANCGFPPEPGAKSSLLMGSSSVRNRFLPPGPSPFTMDFK